MDCPVPKCHEDFEKKLLAKADLKDSMKGYEKLKTLLGTKVSKRAAIIAFSLVGLPILGGGLTVWSDYVPRDKIASYANNIAVLQERNQMISDDMKDVKAELALIRTGLNKLFTHISDMNRGEHQW